MATACQVWDNQLENIYHFLQQNPSAISHFRTVEISDPAFEQQGLRFLTVKTPNLRGRGDICLYVPETGVDASDLPIYILLHGVYGSAWSWAWQGGAHITAGNLMRTRHIQAAIIAMPSDGLWGDGSAYRTHHARHFGRWIVEDVPRVIREHIPQAGAGSPLCLGGLSMGGYGAMMLGGSHPRQFRAISAHSAITRLSEMQYFVEEPLAEYQSNADLENVIDVLSTNHKELPPLRFDCGQEDQLLEGNRLLHREFSALDISHQYQEFAGGHTWSYWQKQLEHSLRFFDQSIHGI